jgi:hypothetical protein
MRKNKTKNNFKVVMNKLKRKSKQRNHNITKNIYNS